MATFLTTVIVIACLLACLAIYLSRLKREAEALEEELDQDFCEEFELDSVGEPSDRGMQELVEWLEEDVRAERLADLEELPEPRKTKEDA